MKKWGLIRFDYVLLGFSRFSTSSYARWRRAQQTADTPRTGRPTSPMLSPECKLDLLPPALFFLLFSHRLQFPGSVRRRRLTCYICYLIVLPLFMASVYPQSPPPVLGFVYSYELNGFGGYFALVEDCSKVVSGRWPSFCFRMSLSFRHVKRMCRTFVFLFRFFLLFIYLFFVIILYASCRHVF